MSESRGECEGAYNKLVFLARLSTVIAVRLFSTLVYS